MELWEPNGYWLVRFLLKRGLGLVYLLAFLVAARQFRPLAGEDGLLPIENYVERREFRDAPSLFYFVPTDRALGAAAWVGVGLAFLAVTGVADSFGTLVSVVVWGTMWVLYLSFVNAGQQFYGFGWESMLCECGFLAIFLGAQDVAAPFLVILLFRWVLFRNMFGAGLIKIRGDECWRDLTCMDYHYETQPMPNPLSWWAHHRPDWFHRGEVLGNHVMELVIPFLYFAPQPFAAIAGVLTVLFQGWLMLTGNFSWLNFITVVLAFSTFSDPLLAALPLLSVPAGVAAVPLFLQVLVVALVLLVGALSYYPVTNMLSERQAMNASFDPLNLVNTYGAFGSITRERFQLVVEGTTDEDPADAEWTEYAFLGQPTKTDRRPPQWAPYHLRLDWQLWFAAMARSPRRHPWFLPFLRKLAAGDEQVERLLREVPFDEGPEYVRAVRYRYRFTDPEERAETGDWWVRERVGTFVGPVDEEGRVGGRQTGSEFYRR